MGSRSVNRGKKKQLKLVFDSGYVASVDGALLNLLDRVNTLEAKAHTTPMLMRAHKRADYILAAVQKSMRFMGGIQYHVPSPTEFQIEIAYKNHCVINVKCSDTSTRVTFVRRDGRIICETYQTNSDACANLASIAMFYCLR